MAGLVPAISIWGPSPGAGQGADIVPLVGARRRDRLTEALGALKVKLPPADLAELTNAFPPGVAAGKRYPERSSCIWTASGSSRREDKGPALSDTSPLRGEVDRARGETFTHAH